MQESEVSIEERGKEEPASNAYEDCRDSALTSKIMLSTTSKVWQIHTGTNAKTIFRI